jgi:hypothetical protein
MIRQARTPEKKRAFFTEEKCDPDPESAWVCAGIYYDRLCRSKRTGCVLVDINSFTRERAAPGTTLTSLTPSNLHAHRTSHEIARVERA